MMFPLQNLQPVDYLVFGHLTVDLTPQGPRIGGTAAFAALTAQALGLRTGIVTSWGAEIHLDSLSTIPIVSYPADASTTFENIHTPTGRIQYIRSVAEDIHMNIIPDPWFNAQIIHLGPVAQEVDPTIIRSFPNSLIGLTPQGWLRSWNEEGLVTPCEWPEGAFVLGQAGATVLSAEDVGNDESRIEEMAASCHILAVTEGYLGSRVYWNGDVRRFHAPPVSEVDPIGAGDIYATSFFIRLYDTRDPWEAGRFATLIASNSVTRSGLSSIPTAEEILDCTIEVF